MILPTQTWEASRPPRDVHRPADRVPVVPQAVPGRPPAGGVRRQEAKPGVEVDPDDVDINELVACPNCGTRGAWTEPRQFNMMLKTYLGVVEDESGLHYLRPETAQGIFLNFVNVDEHLAARSRRSASPRSARASATRSPPATSSSAPASSSRWRWSSSSSPARTRSGTSTGSTSAPAGTSTSASTRTTCGTTSTRRRSCRTTPSAPSTSSTASASPAREWGELEGIANRTDFDLTTHSEHSGQDLSYFDQATGERYTPYVIEPAAGLNRVDDGVPGRRLHRGRGAEHQGRRRQAHACCGSTRGSRRSRSRCCRCRATPTCPRRRKDLAAELRGAGWNVDFDDAGAIGRRYRRQDEIGTPYCVTVDFDTLEDDAVTDPRARHHEAGADRARPGQRLLRRAAARLLSRRSTAPQRRAACPTRVRRAGRAPLLARAALAARRPPRRSRLSGCAGRRTGSDGARRVAPRAAARDPVARRRP